MPQQVTNQRAIVADLPGPLSIADSGGLYDAAIVTHDIDKAHKTIVQNGEFLPSQVADLGNTFYGRLTGFGSRMFLGHGPFCADLRGQARIRALHFQRAAGTVSFLTWLSNDSA